MSQQFEPSKDIATALAESGTHFPFATELSLKPLADFWEDLVRKNPTVYGPTGRQIREGLREASVLTVPDGGLERHFKLEFLPRFVDVRTRGEVPRLPPDALERVRGALLDPSTLADLLPTDRFVISGLVMIRAMDVTAQEVLSSLKRDLIHRE